MLTCFTVIWAISYLQSIMIDKAFEDKLEGKAHGDTEYLIARGISVIISALLVFFNKFVLGDIVHHIVDDEMWSTKTKLNISFGVKLTLALFFNTAMITLAVEILAFDNFYGTGGRTPRLFRLFFSVFSQ